MNIHQEENGSLVLELTQAESKALAKQIIQHAEDAHTSVLNLGYLINEAKFGAVNTFRQPPNPWEPHKPQANQK